MPRETVNDKRRRLSLKNGTTLNRFHFAEMCKQKPHRIGIISEGDSWFAYPGKWVIFDADINIVHHIADKVENTDTVNMLRLASNGDEAVDMTSGRQFRILRKILEKNHEYIKLVLFSGGGNDIVGKDDMLPLLNTYNPGDSYMDCIHLARFGLKIDSIVLAYKRLIALCEEVVPDAKIVTHTYDIAKPWDQGAEFFWGIIKTMPWVYPYMEERGIPKKHHLPIMKYMLETFGAKIVELGNESDSNGRLVVVQTQGTLRPGSKVDWLNEIHPTKKGFRKITAKIYKQMKAIEPGLPKW